MPNVGRLITELCVVAYPICSVHHQIADQSVLFIKIARLIGLVLIKSVEILALVHVVLMLSAQRRIINRCVRALTATKVIPMQAAILDKVSVISISNL